MKNNIKVFIIILLAFNVLLAGDKSDSKARKPAKATVSWAKRVKQTSGEFSVWLSNQMVMGVQAWDGSPPADDCGSVGLGAVYPASSCVEHLYGAGPWIGGIQDGVRKVTEGYNGNSGFGYLRPEQKDTARDVIWNASRSDTLLDPSRPGFYKKGMGQRDLDDDGDGLVDEDELDGFDNDGDWVAATDDLGKDGLPDGSEIGCKGAWDPVRNPDPAFDNLEVLKKDSCHPDALGQLPFKRSKDHYTQGNGIPDHGEPNVDEDYFAYSDNDLYMSATDTFSSPPTGHRPLKIKVFQRAYAWGDPNLHGIIPMEYLFINVGRKGNSRDIIRDVYVGFFADMDVGLTGSAASNYAAYIDSLRTAYIHNPVYQGATPLGLTVLEAPTALESLQYTFQWHEFSAPCGTTIDSALYSCMSCEAFGAGNCIKANQAENSLSDTRFIFTFGPFDEILPGDTLKIAVALVVGDGVGGGEGSLVDHAEKALKLWSKNYRTPKIPPSPCLDTTIGFKKITLRWGGGGVASLGNEQYICDPGRHPLETWDDSSRIAGSRPADDWRRINPPSGHTKGGRIFEGYRLYRSENEIYDPKSFTLIKQFDIPGDEFEYNVGVETTFVDTNLFRGKTYWYSVTSFGIPDLTIITRPLPGGSIIYDSLLSENTESDLKENAIRVKLPFSISEKLGEVLAVPNPYRVDQNYTRENGGFEGENAFWDETKRNIKFIHLPRKATIRVFTIAGDLVTTLEHDAGEEDRGELDWNILSESDRALASGIYVFTVESEYGRQVGKFVLIR